MTARPSSPRDVVAIVLATGLALALVIIVAAAMWDAVYSSDPGLSENSTQVLIAGMGGIVGLLGGYLGGRAVGRRDDRDESDDDPRS